MSRYRPPRPKSSPYITPEGKRRLLDELSDLWKNKRPAVTKSVSEAAAQGDRSENAEYIYGKKMLREIDGRIRFLQKRLDELVVVEHAPPERNRVYFGAWVELETEDGEIVKYRIVGADEIDIERGFISLDSPLAQAILKKALDDEVELKTPQGIVRYIIVNIDYQNSSD